MAGGINSTVTKTRSGHLDLLNSTLEYVSRDSIAETQRYPKYTLTRAFFEDAKEDTSGGTHVEFEVRMRASGTAQWTAPYATSANVIQNLTVKGQVPWRAWEEKIHYSLLEKNMNMGRERLLDMQIPKMNGALEGIWNLIEEALCGSLPTINDAESLLGLGYWLSPCGTVSSGNYVTASDFAGGFNGQAFRADDGTASYTIGGIDASDVANYNWRTWCATHQGVMDSTLIQTIVRAAVDTDFETVPGIQGGTERSGGQMFLVMGHTMATQYESIINSGSDPLGGDAAGKMNGKIRGIPVKRAKSLDRYSSLDVYGVNTRHIYGRVLAGFWMEKLPYINDRDSMHTYTAAILGQGQLLCDNRRNAGFRIHAPIAST